MQERVPIEEVDFPAVAVKGIEEGNLDVALAPENFQGHERAMEEVLGFVERLTASQRSLLRDALSHSLGEGHGGRVAFFRHAVGYELAGIGLDVIDSSVTEEEKVEPLAIVFVLQNQSSGQEAG